MLALRAANNATRGRAHDLKRTPWLIHRRHAGMQRRHAPSSPGTRGSQAPRVFAPSIACRHASTPLIYSRRRPIARAPLAIVNVASRRRRSR